MRDGIHLAADVYLPAGVSSAPVILSRTPYEASSDRFASLGVYFASSRVRGGGAGLSRLFPVRG
jgi:predicted acyl esterase